MIAKAAKSTKEISNKLIIDLSWQSVNVRLGKNEIVELDSKNPALMANLPTYTPKNQGPDFFSRLF